MTGEIIIGKTKYTHVVKNDKDYLIDISNKPIKINFRFTRDSEKNEKAKNGLKTFFTEILS